MKTKLIPLIVLLAALSAALGAPALAEEGVRVQVEIIYASNQSRPTARSLSRLMGQLTSTFNFASYTLLERREMFLTQGNLEKSTIPGGKYLTVGFAGASGGRAKLMVTVSDARREILSTMFSTSSGQTVLLGGPAYEDGSLIIAIKSDFRNPTGRAE